MYCFWLWVGIRVFCEVAWECALTVIGAIFDREADDKADTETDVSDTCDREAGDDDNCYSRAIDGHANTNIDGHANTNIVMEDVLGLASFLRPKLEEPEEPESPDRPDSPNPFWSRAPVKHESQSPEPI